MHPEFPKIADRIIEWGVIFLLVFTPLALPTRYGTVHLWVYTTMELAIFFLVVIWLLKLIVINSGKASIIPNPFSVNRFGFVKTPLNIPIILLVGLILFQLIPLPPGVLKFFSPNTYNLYHITLPGWPTANQTGIQTSVYPNSATNATIPTNQVPKTTNLKSEIPNLKSLRPKDTVSIWRTISIYPYATKSELLKILAYIGMFFLITNTPALRMSRIVVIIISVGFFISFLAILQKFTGTKNIYWMIDVSYASPFGTFVNRNHFAGYIGMLIPLAFGLLVSRFGNIAFHKTMTWRSILSRFESHILGNTLLIFGIIIMISALFLSLSRGGILSFAVTIVVFITLTGLNRRIRSIVSKGRKIIITVLILAFIFLIWIGLGPILNRLSDLSSAGRYEVFQNTMSMAKDFPAFGTGLGTFQYLFPKYKTLEIQRIYDHAHNDYLEFISDTGFIGFMIVVGGIIIFLREMLTRWWKRRDPYAKGIVLGGCCSIIAILSHSFVDFNLHIPANALFLSFILGFTYNAVNLKSDRVEK